MSTFIYHFVHADEFALRSVDGSYTPARFAVDGFVHLSPIDLVAQVANGLIHGRNGFILLAVDPDKVPHRIMWENLEGGLNLFPHIYGPIPVEAIVKTYPFEPDSEGRFSVPPELR